MKADAMDRRALRFRNGAHLVGAFVLVVAGLIATGAGAKDEKQLPNTWYVATISSSDTGALVTHQWSKGRLFRAELVISGRKIVTIVNGKYYYTLDPTYGKGVRIERGPKALADDDENERPFGNQWKELSSTGAEKIRSDTLGGATVDVYQVSDGGGRRRVWISRSEPRLPYRMETFDRRTSSNSTRDYSGWHQGLDLADSFFRPDSNIELENFTYEEFRTKAASQVVGPVPPLFVALLHGERGH